MEITAEAESWPLAEVFTISRGSRTETELVSVTLTDGDVVGRGECMANPRYDETQESVLATLNDLDLGGSMDREKLQTLLPASAARNALDCAFWDLEAKRAGKRAWEIAGLSAPVSVTTAYTLSLNTPENMGAAARRHADRPLLKLKVTGDGDVARVAAVRDGAPDARLIVDANEGWTPDMVTPLGTELGSLGVEMIEQPLPAAEDSALADIPHPVPFCADESCHTSADLAHLEGRYDLVNIKLDKTGGLTEALKLKEQALEMGFGVMVGCMVATSLAMAPAHLVAQGAAYVDIDGPLLLAKDRPNGLKFDGSFVEPPDAELWG
ncbi:MAG TPA: dipeptide epimerase [Rhodospirillaceae bacterium]|nr:dipeptide epimerase [Rhodospirillaceae bacterium]HAA92221.1 dipeptide epimerase [Rhodospirillaceae bacterium]HAT35497.1 dipeptide epimerase [Rhodospirillaceae bacterium]